MQAGLSQYKGGRPAAGRPPAKTNRANISEADWQSLCCQSASQEPTTVVTERGIEIEASRCGHQLRTMKFGDQVAFVHLVDEND